MAALLLPGVRSGASAAETFGACAAAYDRRYMELWELPKSSWRAACGAERESREILRSLQNAFARKCAVIFAESIRMGLTNKSTVDAYCAQGAPGRARLAAMLKVSLPAEPAKAAEAEPSGRALPASGGMGPLMAAMDAAKAKWGDDLCFTAMAYEWKPQRVNKEKIVRGRSSLVGREDHIERYFYYYYSPSMPQEGYSASYYDNVDIFKIVLDRLKGPELIRGTKDMGSDCLQRVDTEPHQIMAAARKGGLVLGEVDTYVYLLSRDSWREFYQRCERGLKKNLTFWCNRPITRRMKRKVRGKEIWLVNNGYKSAIIDAEKGEFLLLISDALNPTRLPKF